MRIAYASIADDYNATVRVMAACLAVPLTTINIRGREASIRSTRYTRPIIYSEQSSF